MTKDKFMSYLEVQKSGLYNMLDPRAIEATGLSKEDYLYIIKNYSKLQEEYQISTEDVL